MNYPAIKRLKLEHIFDESKIERIKELHSKGFSVEELAKLNSIKPSAIREIVDPKYLEYVKGKQRHNQKKWDRKNSKKESHKERKKNWVKNNPEKVKKYKQKAKSNNARLQRVKRGSHIRLFFKLIETIERYNKR